jgi:hypothetical protein
VGGGIVSGGRGDGVGGCDGGVVEATVAVLVVVVVMAEVRHPSLT